MVLSVPKMPPLPPKKRGLSSPLPKKEGPQWPWFHTGRNLKEKRKMSPSDIYFFNKTEGKIGKTTHLTTYQGRLNMKKYKIRSGNTPKYRRREKRSPLIYIYIYICIVNKTGEEIGKKPT